MVRPMNRRIIVRLLAAWVVGVVLTTPVIAQMMQAIVGGSGSAGVTYTGPGDQQAFTAWYGLRCYSTATATGSQKAVTVRAASGPNATTSTDIVCLSNGKLDVATAETFSGTDATCTASSISTVTLTVGTCDANVTIGDRLTGTGVTAGTYVKAGSCTTTPGSTCTVSISQTVGSTTITAHGALFASTLYNQAGTTPCATSTACNLVQGTADNTHQPILLTVCQGLTTLPCLVSQSTSVVMVSANNFTPNAAKIGTFSWVYNRISGTAGVNAITENGANGAGTNIGASAVRVLGGASGSVTETCSDTAWHAGAGVANTTSSIAYCDNTAGSTGTVTNNSNAGAPNGVGVGSSSVMLWAEMGFVDNVVADSTVIGNLHTNQSAYWGTP
jgi:hypothetical protein